MGHDANDVGAHDVRKKPGRAGRVLTRRIGGSSKRYRLKRLVRSGIVRARILLAWNGRRGAGTEKPGLKRPGVSSVGEERGRLKRDQYFATTGAMVSNL